MLFQLICYRPKEEFSSALFIHLNDVLAGSIQKNYDKNDYFDDMQSCINVHLIHGAWILILNETETHSLYVRLHFTILREQQDVHQFIPNLYSLSTCDLFIIIITGNLNITITVNTRILKKSWGWALQPR